MNYPKLGLLGQRIISIGFEAMLSNITRYLCLGSFFSEYFFTTCESFVWIILFGNVSSFFSSKVVRSFILVPMGNVQICYIIILLLLFIFISLTIQINRCHFVLWLWYSTHSRIGIPKQIENWRPSSHSTFICIFVFVQRQFCYFIIPVLSLEYRV